MKTALVAAAMFVLVVLIAGVAGSYPVTPGLAVAPADVSGSAPAPAAASGGPAAQGSGAASGATAPEAADPAAAGPLSFDIRGFNFPSWQSSGYQSPAGQESLGRLAQTGANWVAIDPTQYMQTPGSDTIGADPGGRSATDASVAAAIDKAHSLGLKVMLKPTVDVQDGSCRCQIAPADTGAWFSSYGGMMAGYAALAQAHHVELLVVGTELASLSGSDNRGRWDAIITRVRSVYPGPLTYASTQSEYNRLSFWDRLDYLGIDDYFPLSDAASPSTAQLMSGWTAYSGSYGAADWLAAIERWQTRWHKPVIFTELGYRSVDHAARAPWDYSFEGRYDGGLQARAIDAAFRMLNGKPWVAGVFWWAWYAGDNGGNPQNTDYTISGKPSEAMITGWYESAPPRLNVSVAATGWSSYQDYQSGLLSVDFRVENSGKGTARETRVEGEPAGSGVVAAGESTTALGDIAPGGVTGLRVFYRVPPQVASFRAVVELVCTDLRGDARNFPGQNGS